MTIILKNILKTYKGQAILENLNLQVETGEFHVMLGLSGCGKTTLLSIIAGLIKQDGGTVYLNDKNVNDLPPGKRSIGFTFQDYALFPHLTVFENVAFGPRAGSMEERMVTEKVEYYLKKVNLENENEKFPHQLSGGQKQRVALARTLVNEPEILLMDEPMSSLDPFTKEKITEELKNIQNETGVTIIYVTHNQKEAMALGSRISVLNHGIIEQIDTPKRLFYNPKTEFVENFMKAW